MPTKPWLLGVALLIGFLPVVGCTTTPQADSRNFKNARTQNNAELNHSALVATTFVPREDLSQIIVRDVPGIATADVLEREGRVFVGVTLQVADLNQPTKSTQSRTSRANNHPQSPKRAEARATLWSSEKQQVMNVVRKVMPKAKAIYVTNDETLTYHFHMFAGDRATGRWTGSDIVMNDISRVFPNYS